MLKVTKQVTANGVAAVNARVRVFIEGTSQLAPVFFDEAGERRIPGAEILVSSTGIIEFFAEDNSYTLEVYYNEAIAHENVRPSNVLIQEGDSFVSDSVNIEGETVIALDTAGTSHLFCRVKLEDAETTFVDPTAYPVGKRLTLVLEWPDVGGAVVNFSEKFCSLSLSAEGASTRKVLEFVCDGLCFVAMNNPTVVPYVFQE